MFPEIRINPICMTLMNQIDNCITNICLKPIFSEMNFLAHKVHVENGVLRNGCLLSMLSAQDGNSPRPQQWIIESHQLHFRKVYSERGYQHECLITVTDSNPCLSLIIHILNTKVVISKKYFLQLLNRTQSQKATLNRTDLHALSAFTQIKACQRICVTSLLDVQTKRKHWAYFWALACVVSQVTFYMLQLTIFQTIQKSKMNFSLVSCFLEYIKTARTVTFSGR